ncbi:MAG: hypothetical protein GTN62_08255 [Gemmatimonadales bacterium]|nr:hypothetical protein [Gemmatimonadales bacterium]NIN50092.1 hypothetical protein [Gemmatimonadales bacterium]NIP07556.1 hypothetical protein [Gemmatimonadales bacterium]NIR01712.1 hypothetical protein [Gemmatimonadales bacterium]NIS65615.1 hypothetical protein [Gemmatimonadales bacterium]
MTEERFQQFLRDAAQDYNRPPEAPREEIWRAIQAIRRERRERPRPQWLHRVLAAPSVRWGVGIAAALVIGIGVGRLSMRGDVAGEAGAVAENGGAAGAEAAFQWVTAQHLGQVETLLTGFRVDARLGRPVAQSGGAARELLSTTRLLLDSPVSEDQALRSLLEDVELVLAQIALFSSRRAPEELEIIDRSIEQRSVLLRLHSAVGAQPSLTGVQGVL